MRLPDLVAYQAAVQHPSTAFGDPALKSATVVTGRLGLPRAVTGNFAVTYELQSGSQRWAIRCFHREAADRASRYAAISQTLASAGHGPLVPIEYVQNGVRVGQTWYPITRMPWIDGHPLNVAIEAHLGEVRFLGALERRFTALVADLRKLAIAHGDLQHGNVLVDAAGNLRLVDYDGMFVPALRGRSASETGDPNYQHPRRSAQFDAELDRFSALVIVIALRALAAEPSLWRTYNTGDNLLFRRADFADPSHSKLLRDLSGIASVRELAERFAKVCESDFARVPTLDEFLRVRATTSPRSWTLRRSTLQSVIAFSSDDALVASGEREGKIHIRERDSGRSKRTLRADGPVEALAFTPGGDVRVVRREGALLSVGGHQFTARSLVCASALSPDAEWLTCVDDHGLVTCWKISSGRATATFSVSSVVAMALDGQQIAVADKRGTVWLYRMRDGVRFAGFAVGGGVTCLAMRAGRLAVGHAQGYVTVWDIAAQQPAFRDVELGFAPIECVALSSDCTRVAASTRDGAVSVRRLRAVPKRAPVSAEPARIVRIFDWLRRVALL